MAPHDAESNEAVRFYHSLGPDFDTAAPLRWSFLLEGVAEDQVGQLMEMLGGMGFTEAEPMAAEEQEGQYILWFAEVCLHTAESFARRVAAVEQLAVREGLVVSDFSAGREK